MIGSNNKLQCSTTIPNVGAKGSHKFRRYGQKPGYFVVVEDLSARTATLTVTLTTGTQPFSHDTPGHGDAPSRQVWFHTVQWFTKDIFRTNGLTDGQKKTLVLI